MSALRAPGGRDLMEWKFFFGACLLVGAALVPHAGLAPVAAGIALAATLRWVWYQLRQRASH
jgi:hypothetical protein